MIILDLETTGLDPDKCCILEVVALRVDNDLDLVGEEFERVVWQPEEVLRGLPLEVLKMHTDNNLLAAVHEIRNMHQHRSSAKNGLERVEDDLLLWLANEPAPRYLAGDSIHFDRSFLRVHMPRVHEALHHRMVDTSSFAVAHEMWGKPVAAKPENPPHRALADCYLSLAKLKFYRGVP